MARHALDLDLLVPSALHVGSTHFERVIGIESGVNALPRSPLVSNTAWREGPDGWPLTAPLFLETFENEVEMLLYSVVSLDTWTAALRLG